ncbi:MAG: hypothetical protein KAT68_06380 [Bacteroidales bacterium]|nr:hypothetical protein [Bacteroidales bacterium]
MRFIYITVIFFLYLNDICYPQLVQKVELINPKIVIRESFIECENHHDISFTGIDTVYGEMKNENIVIHLEYKNGQKYKAIGYYSNNQTYRECTFKNNKKNGFDMIWYKNGQKKYLTYYKKDKILYPIIGWHNNGNLSSFIDEDNKVTKSWFVNGNIEEESSPIDSTKEGLFIKTYYEEGGISSLGYFNIGVSVYSTFYKNNKKAMQGNIYNTRLFQLGHWQEWFENGVKKRKYYFNENIPNWKEGTWSWWDENGNLVKQEIYKNNVLIDKKEFIPMKIKKD